MKIFVTFDYELFFGKQSGSVNKCLLQPTQDLFELAKGRDLRYTFFVDVGYLISAEKYPELSEELSLVKRQILEMGSLGHDVQLHIHPHWEKAKFVNGAWKMNTRYSYKLADFEESDAREIFRKYKSHLERLSGKKVTVYRAGGWCVQPFSTIKKSCLELGIKADSSVYPGAYLQTDDYDVDFRGAPRKSKYRFEDDVCVEAENGSFIEFPISTYRYNPSFYWQLYGLGKLFPKQHKMIGDGTFIAQGGSKFKSLTGFTENYVSCDGYFAKKLISALIKCINLEQDEMVILGHPKGNTIYSMTKLKEFIQLNDKKHQFTSFEREL